MDLPDDTILDGPPDAERLEWERASRATIKRIFEAALMDNMSAVFDLYRESRQQGDWFHVAVWCGLPNTLKDRIREYDTQRTDTRESGRDSDVVSDD